MSPLIRIAISWGILSSILIAPPGLTRETPVLLLPSHIEAPAGTVSLIADFNAVGSQGRVPVYLVNNSPAELVLRSQDGDIFLKLEYLNSDGTWVRAQPHGYSWCGNSYFNRTIPSGHYLLVSGYQPINGGRHTIRYRLYSQGIDLISNTGDGVVADLDVRLAASDAMSVRHGDFNYVVSLASSDMPLINEMDHIRDLREAAIRELASGRFNPEESRQVLLRVRERHPEMIETVDRAINYLERRQADSTTEPGR